MNAKTYFLSNSDNVFIYTDINHFDNYQNYMQENYPFVEITEYIPHLLMKNFDHVIIDVADSYRIVNFYLSDSISEFQKKYIVSNRKLFENYGIYYSKMQEGPRSIDDLILYLEELPIREVSKNKLIIKSFSK